MSRVVGLPMIFEPVKRWYRFSYTRYCDCARRVSTALPCHSQYRVSSLITGSKIVGHLDSRWIRNPLKIFIPLIKSKTPKKLNKEKISYTKKISSSNPANTNRQINHEDPFHSISSHPFDTCLRRMCIARNCKSKVANY